MRKARCILRIYRRGGLLIRRLRAAGIGLIAALLRGGIGCAGSIGLLLGGLNGGGGGRVLRIFGVLCARRGILRRGTILGIGWAGGIVGILHAGRIVGILRAAHAVLLRCMALGAALARGLLHGVLLLSVKINLGMFFIIPYSRRLSTRAFAENCKIHA